MAVHACSARPPERQPVTIGPRIEANIRRRIRELEGRCPKAMTKHDLIELQALREWLNRAGKE